MADPKFHNYYNLKDDDRVKIDNQLSMIELINDEIAECKMWEKIETSILEKISYQEGIRALERLKDNVLEKIINDIISIIDSYNEQVLPIKTDNYLFGYKNVDL